MRSTSRHLALVLATVFGAALSVACGSTKTDTASSGVETNTTVGKDLTDFPSGLAARIVDLNACKSRLQGTHGTFPVQSIQAESEGTPILYAYYNLDMSGINGPFTQPVAGQTDQCVLPANNAIGTVRAVLEPKADAVVDANDPRSLVDIFTDVCGLVVINNESGWYEGWITHDIRVPLVDTAALSGQPASFNHITQADADALKALGEGHNLPGAIFTTDGLAPHAAVKGDELMSGRSTNMVSVTVSLGTWNALQGEDAHAYWELNEYTNWVFPTYEIPGTGGVTVDFRQGFQYGPLGGLGPNVDSRIAGSGPSGILNNITVDGKVRLGDDPLNPRDADRTPESCGDSAAQAEKRLRFIPSGLAREIQLDAFVRRASFEPDVRDSERRLLDAYALEVAKFDKNKDGVIQFDEADIDDESNGLPNTRLYLAPVDFNRVSITREINDGLLAPRLAPSAQAHVLEGNATMIEQACEGPMSKDAGTSKDAGKSKNHDK
jgi:hypothetical protein